MLEEMCVVGSAPTIADVVVMVVLLTGMLRSFSVVLETVAVILTSGDIVNGGTVVEMFTRPVWLELMELSELGVAGDGPTSDLSSVCTIQYKDKLGHT